MSGDNSNKTESGSSNTRMVAIAILAAAVGAFIVQNTSTVDLDWLMFGFSAPLWLMLLLMVAVGVAIGYILGRNRRKAA